MKRLILLSLIFVSCVATYAQVGDDLIVKKSDMKGAKIASVYSNEYRIFYGVDLSELDVAATEFFKEEIYKSKSLFPASVLNEDKIWVLGVMKSEDQNQVKSTIEKLILASKEHSQKLPANSKQNIKVK